MKSSTVWPARSPAMGVLLLVPVLLLAIACATSGLAQSPEATTAPEVTEAPATDAPATDAPAESAAPEPDEGDEGDSDDSTIPTWGWALIAGVLGIVLLAFLALLRRGSSVGGPVDSQAQWHAAALDAYASSAAISDIVAANLNAEALGDAPEAVERRWEGARRRINDRTFELHLLEARTQDPAAAALVRQLVADLSALRSAVDAHLSLQSRADAAQLTETQVAQSESTVKERLSQFGGSLDAFKAHVDRSK